MKKIFFLIFGLIGTFTTVAQNLNSYKYIVVPEKFEFLKEANQYRLNELTQFLLEKKGYSAILEGENSVASSENPCEGLTASVKNESGMFVSRLQLVLKDCRNKEVFISEVGDSRVKDYEKAFNEALREAVASLPQNNSVVEEAIITARAEANKKPEKENRLQGEVVEKTVPAPAGAKPEVGQVESSQKSLDKLMFIKGNGRFYLLRTANGYNFYQQGMGEPFAALIQSSSESNSYVYSSITSKGLARFDEKGNLVVELLSPENNSLESIEYKLER